MKVLINRIVYTRIEDVVNRNLTEWAFIKVLVTYLKTS